MIKMNMKSTTNNGMEKSEMFSSLFGEEPRITLGELQRHVEDSPTPRRIYHYPAIALIAAIALYLASGNVRIEKNTALDAASVKKSATLSSMPPTQTQELKDTKISNLLLSGSKVKRNPKVLHVKNNELGAVNVVKYSALLDPKIFNAVCGKNVFIASTAKIDLMPLLEPAMNDYMNSVVINIQHEPLLN